MRRLFLNAAGRNEIASFLRITDEDADLLIAHRNTVGPILDLGVVNRILPDLPVDDIVDLIELGPETESDRDLSPAPGAPEIDVSDVEVKDMTISADGHGELFSAFATIDPEEGGLPISVPASFKNGAFVVPIPRAFWDRDVRFVVRDPTGAIAAEKAAKGRNLGRLTVKLPKLKAPPQEINAIASNPAVRFPASCVGQVINATGSAVNLAAFELVFFGHPLDASVDGSAMRPIATVRPDAAGKFSLPFPNMLFMRAKARLAYPGAEEMLVPLEADGRFPLRLFLMLNDAPPAGPDGSDTGATASGTPATQAGSRAGSSDCGCHDKTTDSGFSAALRESEGGAGDALAGEDCPKFRANNVVVDEQEYTMAVRLDQPVVEPLILEQPEDLADKYIQVLRHRLGGGMQVMSLISGEAIAFDPTSSLTTFSMLEKKAIAKVYGKGDLWSRYGKRSKSKGEMSTKDKLRRDLSIASRPPLSKDFQLDWDDEPTTAQAVTAARGHLLRIKQEWVTDGYSLGALLHTTPLAPGQAKRIAVIDWTRAETGERDEDLGQSERLAAEIERQRSISETINGVVTQFNAGASAAGTAGQGIAGGLAGPAGPALGFIGAVAGVGVSGAGSIQYGNRKIGANSLQNVSDATRQSAGSVRQRNASTVVVTDQEEFAGASTEVIANYNHCHSLNIHHFEVLRHFLVRTRLADVQECVFVPLKMSPFDPDKILRWQDEIAQVLPRRERPGLWALQRLMEYWPDVKPDERDDTLADAEVDAVELTLTLEARFVRPRTTQERLNTALETEMRRETEDDAGFFGRLKGAARAATTAAYDFLTASPVPNAIKNLLLDDTLNSRDADRAFNDAFPYMIRDILNRKLQVSAEAGSGRQISLGSADVTILGTPRNNRSFSIKVRLRPQNISRKALSTIKIGCPNSHSLFPEHSHLLLQRATVMIRQDNVRKRLFSGNVNDDISDAGGNTDFAVIDIPLSRAEQENLFERDIRRARRLLVYLNRELEQFHRQIWLRMDKARRYMLLDGVQAPKSERSLAQVTDNELIGVVGNMLVLPVGRGRSLFPELEAADSSGVAEPVDLLAAYAPTTPIDPIRVSLPTGGVHAEAVMGNCNSCEKIDNSRYWKWEEHPIPLMPDAISGDMLGSRRSDMDLRASGFDPALVGMQVPGDLPDPTSLASMLEAIVRSDSFRDAAGLTQTQQSALAAYTQGIQGAQAMASKAQELLIPGKDGISPVQQRYVSQNMQAIADQIDRLDLPDDIKNALKKRMVETVVGKADVPEKKESKDKPDPDPKPKPTPDPDPKPDPDKPKKPGKRPADPDAGVYVIEIDPKTFLFLNFPVGEADVHPKHIEGLRLIAQRMTDHTDLVSMTGHASPSGNDNDNLSLSIRRANALFAEMLKLGPKDLVRPQIVDGVGEGRPSVRSQFGNDPKVRPITGETHKNDPVERSVVVRLKDALPKKQEPAKVENDGDVYFYFGPFLWLGSMFSNNRFYIDGGDVFYGDEKIEGDTHITRRNNTRVEIKIEGPLFQIGDITFNISNGKFEEPKKKDDSGGGTAPKVGNKWVIKFHTPDLSDAESLIGVIKKILKLLEKAAGSNYFASTAIEIIRDTLLPALESLGNFAIGSIKVPATVWLLEDASERIDGAFQARGVALLTGSSGGKMALPIVKAISGLEIDAMGRAIYETAGDPFAVSEWERFARLEKLTYSNFSGIDDLKTVLTALERLLSIIDLIDDISTEFVGALKKFIDAITDVIGIKPGDLVFAARGNPEDPVALAEIGGSNLFSVVSLTSKRITFTK